MTNDQLTKAEALLDDAEAVLRPSILVIMQNDAAGPAPRVVESWKSAVIHDRLRVVREACSLAQARIALAVTVESSSALAAMHEGAERDKGKR